MVIHNVLLATIIVLVLFTLMLLANMLLYLVRGLQVMQRYLDKEKDVPEPKIVYMEAEDKQEEIDEDKLNKEQEVYKGVVEAINDFMMGDDNE